ncbi:MAG: RimK-like ATPgrasp N-terminal domain-containing protein [Methanolinea sp.]|nr:RimK-like ATPgrasp N-terminal domain-containing protein [Methanolinea sp.]
MPGEQLVLDRFLEELAAGTPEPDSASRQKTGRRTLLSRERIHFAEIGGIAHLIAENYSYKSEAYYALLSRELAGDSVAPDTASLLDAFIVPLCIERSRGAGIPVAECVISHTYLPCPSVVYGLNYFACASHYEVAKESTEARDVVKHVTNGGKYPFCFQRLEEGASLERHVSLFGRVLEGGSREDLLAEKVYRTFRIPLVELVCITGPGGTFLSSLCPVRYSQLSRDEREILCSHITGQGLL